MFSFSFSALLAFLLLYVPSTTIAKRSARTDPTQCKTFYNVASAGWRGGTNCWCPDEKKFGSNFYWYHSGTNKVHQFKDGEQFFSYYQGENFAQTWVNCNTSAPGVENVNVEWAAMHCNGIPNEKGMNGWGNSYDYKPGRRTAPLEGLYSDIKYAMRCEYPDHVAVQCLCTEKDPPEGGAQICNKRQKYCADYVWWCRRWSHKEWGIYNYSSPEYCWKLNIIIDRPLGTICSEHAHCAVGLQCSRGVCSACPNFECPDRTPSDGLSRWGKTCKYGDYECPNNDCARRSQACGPTNVGLGCCEGLKCMELEGVSQQINAKWIEIVLKMMTISARAIFV